MNRLFVAVYPLKGIEEIIDIQNNLRPYIIAKFVERENLHITLSFIGSVSETDTEEIKEKLEGIVKDWKSIITKLDGLEFIPNENFIRVIGIKVISEELTRLSKLIGENVGGSVKPPHLTLCRVKKALDKLELIKMKNSLQLNKKIEVNEISLVRSILKRTGPVYEIIDRYKFSK